MIRFLELAKITNSFQPELGEVIARVLRSGSFIRGKEVGMFEETYASFIGSRYCIGVGSGFDALNLILRAWAVSGLVREGDEVIVPANTYIASILAITENRLVPVLVEPDINTFNIDPGQIEERITPRTKAIMVVHLYGRNAMADQIRDIAARYGLKVVEDNAQATGCMSGASRTGSLADAAAHSFFPTKNLGALGDGGAITTDDPVLDRLVRTLGNYGSGKKGVNDLRGINSRLDELQAAVLSLKLRRLDEDNDRRRAHAIFYHKHIMHDRIALPAFPPKDKIAEHVWHLFVIRCAQRDALQRHLMERNVETLVHYPIPPHMQAAYKEMNRLTFPITEQIHREALSLPLHPLLREGDLQHIADSLNAFRH